MTRACDGRFGGVVGTVSVLHRCRDGQLQRVVGNEGSRSRQETRYGERGGGPRGSKGRPRDRDRIAASLFPSLVTVSTQSLGHSGGDNGESSGRWKRGTVHTQWCWGLDTWIRWVVQNMHTVQTHTIRRDAGAFDHLSNLPDAHGEMTKLWVGDSMRVVLC